MKVLVVEDDSSLGKIVVEIISALGHEARWVESAEEARRILKKENFDFLLSDFNLPGENGLELATFVRDNFPGMPVVIMTGCCRENIRKIRRKGFSVVLRKPFGIEALQKVLEARPAAVVAIPDPEREALAIEKAKKMGYVVHRIFEDAPDILGARVLEKELLRSGNYCYVVILS